MQAIWFWLAKPIAEFLGLVAFVLIVAVICAIQERRRK